MKIKIKEAEKLSIKLLVKLGFSKGDAKLITRNLIDAELTGRKSHGFVRLPAIRRNIQRGKISTTHENIRFTKRTKTTLLVDARNKPAFIAIYKSLDKSIKKAKRVGVFIVGIHNAAYCSGYIGSYARRAAENDLIFIGFNNSPGGLIPYGSKKELWGTNPITVGVPTNDIPIILDMASSKVTFGDLLVTMQEGGRLEKDVALDKDGNPTTDAQKAIEGGILPIAEHKGSGLAFIVEILAGALTGSRVGNAIEGGWGTSYILINPAIFRPLDDSKSDIARAINELKSAPKAQGVKEIYFPGEQSYKLREKNLKKGKIEISDEMYSELWEIINSRE